MADEKFVSAENLRLHAENEKKKFVAQREGYGLSKNDLTDELKEKILNAGDSSFTGNYEDLINKPKIDGYEVDKDSTAESLGLAKKTDIPGVATASTTGLVMVDDETIKVDGTGKISADFDGLATKEELPEIATTTKEGLVKPDDETITIEAGTIKAKQPGIANTDTAGLVKPDGDTITAGLDGTISVVLTGYVTDGSLESKLEELEETIDGKYSAGLVFSGTKAFAELPEPSKDELGKMYSLTTDGEITAEIASKWVDEQGTKIKKGTDVAVGEVTTGVYKWNALASAEDLSNVATKAEVEAAKPQAMSVEEVNALLQED